MTTPWSACSKSTAARSPGVARGAECRGKSWPGAVGQCPRQVKLLSADGQETILAAGGPSVFWTGNAINLAVDKEIVPIDTQRFADLAHVIDGLEHVHAMVGTCLADVPAAGPRAGRDCGCWPRTA